MHAYVSKHGSTWKNKVILLMVIDNKKWLYLAVTNLSTIFRIIILNHVAGFYCLNCLHSFRTENKLKAHKNVCKNYDYWYLEMTGKSLKYNQWEKYFKIPFISYDEKIW